MTNTKDVEAYYNTKESKLGYLLFLKGAKHFGYFDKGDRMYQISKSLRKMERKIGESLSLPAGSKILDAGSGMGAVSRNIARWFKYNITGIDILDFNLSKAREQASRAENADLSLEYLEMDYHQLEFENLTFDGIYTTETFVHASEPKRVLDEFYRVLQPGGKLVQLEYSHDPYDSMNDEEKRSFEFVNKNAAMPAFNLFEHGVHEKLIEDAGFELKSSTDYAKNIEPMLRWFMLNAWLPVKIIRLLKREDHFVNAISAVDFWKLRHKIQVKIIIAEKPSR
jgi:ubiquinone/menaquinone biosynthesis C-methylase UbiE